MASNSKKRRRVLGASCILAALIIASSSFAWFTSKDEVTNRLSANADYDVKLVESFAPPANWLPGADVDKDVYAVNTGSIGAFVEEQVTSKITITKEEKVETSTFATNKDSLIKLTPAERYSIEAGSFLALKPTDSGNEVGYEIVSFGNGLDNGATSPAAPTTLEDYTADTVVTDFYPKAAGAGKKATGLYVFRRAIKVVDADTKAETFEYVGYWYDQDEDAFYKVELESLTPDDVADIADDGKNTDGLLTEATCSLIKETTTVQVPTLKYDADKGYLVATVPGTAGPTDAKLKALAKAYDDAIHEYERALAAYSNAVAENTSATNTEKQALDAYNAAIIDEAKKEKKYKEELARLQAIQKQLKDAIAERDTPSTGLQARRDEALKALIGTVTNMPANVDSYLENDTRTDLPTKKKPASKTEGTDYADGSLFDQLSEAYAAIPASLTNNDKEEFFEDLKAEAKRIKQADATQFTDPAITSIIDGTDNYTAANLTALIDAFTYQQLKDYAVAADADNHDTYASIADYAALLKDYQKKLATFNQLNTELTNLNNRIGANDSAGLKKQFKDQFVAVYSQGNYDTYSDTSYAEDVKTKGEVPALSGITKDNADTYNARTDYYGDLLDARADKLAAKYAYDTATAAVNTNNPNTAGNLADAEAAKAKAAAQLATAKKTYEDAQKAYDEAGDIIINIKLVKDNITTNGGVVDKWQLLPTALEDKVGSDGKTDTATFYYTSILDGGKTSKQLIDSVELDKSVTQDMYKSFDFDLDVKLKSAQMLYDSDNKTILATAVNGDSAATPPIAGELDANVTLANPTNPATALTWAAK